MRSSVVCIGSIQPSKILSTPPGYVLPPVAPLVLREVVGDGGHSPPVDPNARLPCLFHEKKYGQRNIGTFTCLHQSNMPFFSVLNLQRSKLNTSSHLNIANMVREPKRELRDY